MENSVRDRTLDGKVAARKCYENNKIYSGDKELDDGSEAYSKVILNIQVLGLGYMMSAVFFFFELLAALRRWLISNNFVVRGENLSDPLQTCGIFRCKPLFPPW